MQKPQKKTKKSQNPQEQPEKEVEVEETVEVEEIKEEQSRSIVLIPTPSEGSDGPKARMIGLYGKIEEENCAGIIGMMYELRENGKEEVPIDPTKEDSETKTEYTPFDFLISSEGGYVWDAFAVFDVMKDIQKDCEISTIGVGKVMSAGLLLLAAGTKGKRRIGKHCRLMIHSVSGGSYGQLHEQMNNVKEANFVQEQYIKVLVENTKLTRKKILSLFRKKTDIYFDADQAIEWGIADELI